MVLVHTKEDWNETGTFSPRIWKHKHKQPVMQLELKRTNNKQTNKQTNKQASKQTNKQTKTNKQAQSSFHSRDYELRMSNQTSELIFVAAIVLFPFGAIYLTLLQNDQIYSLPQNGQIYTLPHNSRSTHWQHSRCTKGPNSKQHSQLHHFAQMLETPGRVCWRMVSPTIETLTTGSFHHESNFHSPQTAGNYTVEPQLHS